jgi:simple sugar transport system substrate-binding protein
MAAADKVAAGYTPFVGPLKDSTGAPQLSAGYTMDARELNNIDWYVEGVIGRMR